MKRKFNVLLKILVALLLLTSMILTALFNTTSAEFFKSFNKKLDLEMTPDLRLEYYLRDSKATSTTDTTNNGYNVKTGKYDNAENFSQAIIIGKQDKKTVGSTTYYLGENIRYQIKIPVSEPGYYNINFVCRFVYGNRAEPILREEQYALTQQDYPTVNYNYPVGCEIITATDSGFTFGNQYSMEDRLHNNNTKQSYRDGEKVLYSDPGETGDKDSTYQWKTTCPSRSEQVSLTFKVTDADIDDNGNGYVIWAWDLSGLVGEHNYRFECKSLSVRKTMELDGSTETRSSTDPFFMFPQTAFTNSQVSLTSSGNDEASTVPGRTEYSDGRGTFVTSATDNSLTMQAEKLYWGDDTDVSRGYDNPVNLYIPMKNIKPGTNYKVTFDFSVARQGARGPSDTIFIDDPVADEGYLTNDNAPSNWYDYAEFDKIFNVNTKMQSYISPTISGIRDYSQHTPNLSKVTYNNKTYANAPLTKYDEVTKVANLLPSTSTNVNDTYSIEPIGHPNNSDDPSNTNNNTNTAGRNWFNAIQHIEYNEQWAIKWVTFYNTTFSFNIASVDGATTDSNGMYQNLYWIWMLDALKATVYYRIRIDNVRIYEVVDYASGMDENGVKIGGVQIHPQTHADNYYPAKNSSGTPVNLDSNVFYNLRGRTGTGQNYQARWFTDEYTPIGNIYSPIIDARKMPVIPASGSKKDAYKIALSGWTVCKGGVNKYVFSVDGGRTWNDMKFSGTSDTRKTPYTDYDLLKEAEAGVEPVMSQNTKVWGNLDTYNYIKFDGANDSRNCRFGNWSLVADLSKYEGDTYMDIIFAAIPAANSNARCEFLRIINYNTPNSYVSQIEEVASDITTPNGTISVSLNSPDADTSVEKLNYLMACGGGSAPNVESTGEYYTNKYPVYGRGVYSHYMYRSQPIDYIDLYSAFSDIPIKKTLTISGGIVCYQGVVDYHYSIDGGRTWKKINKTMAELPYVTPQEHNNQKSDNPYQVLFAQWMQRTTRDDMYYFKIDSNGSNRNGAFNTSNSEIVIDLSEYAGQTLDIIVAARPTGIYPAMVKNSDGDLERTTLYETKDIYLPVAKISNVAVYGDTGTFYTKISQVTFGGTSTGTTSTSTIEGGTKITPTYLDVMGKPLNHVTSCTNGTNGSTKTITSRWDLGYTAKNAEEFSYTIFEPNNTNVLNARFYNTAENVVESGSKVYIRGYIAAAKGVSGYKYTLDGGKTWTRIQGAGYSNAGTAFDDLYNYARQSDSAFTAENNSFQKGLFRFAADTATGAARDIQFALPALPKDAVRNLLVVAEGVEGNLYPVLHIRLKFKYNNNTTQYGRYDNSNPSTITATECGWFSNTYTKTFTLDKTNTTAKTRLTIPVSEAGDYTLNFTHKFDNPAITKTKNNKQIWVNRTEEELAAGKVITSSGQIKVDSSISVPKTHFLVGEPIEVTYSIKRSSGNTETGSPGKSSILLVSADWRNNYSNRHALRSQGNITVDSNFTASGTVDLNAKPNANSGLPKLLHTLSAGKYQIYFANRPNNFTEVESDEKWRLTDPITIYIHDPSETASLAIVHDEGEYTYFSDMESQISHYDDANPDSRVDRIHLFDNSGTKFSLGEQKTFSVNVHVTEADAKRGYIILDTDYTKLLSTQKHPQDACQDIINELIAHGEDKAIITSKVAGNGVTIYSAEINANGEPFHSNDRCVSPDWYTTKENKTFFIKQNTSTPYNVTITINSFTKN